MSVDKLIEKEPSLEFIITVLKWLKDPESVSQDELEANYKAALAYDATCADYIPAAYAADTAGFAGATATSATYAELWIKRYFGEISITREEVESELFKGEEMEYNKEFFNKAKIKIESEEHNEYVQGLSFKADCSWLSGGKSFKWNDADFLYFGSNGWISCTRGAGIAKFETHKYKEIFIPMPAKEAEPVNDVVQNPKLATDYLDECKAVQEERGKQYDSESTGERSFQSAADAFNALSGEKLSGSDVCLLLTCLKFVRQNSDKSRLHEDSLLDAVSYTSLWAEELNKELL